MKYTALILILMVGNAISSELFVHNINTFKNSVEIEIINNENSSPLYCSGKYNVEIKDDLTFIDSAYKTLIFNNYYVPAKNRKVYTFDYASGPNQNVSVIAVKKLDEIHCKRTVTVGESKTTLESYLANGHVSEAVSHYRQMSPAQKQTAAYLDLTGTNFDYKGDIFALSQALNGAYINYNETPYMTREFKQDPSLRTCQRRENVKCGVNFKLKTSSLCGVKSFKAKRDKSCGVEKYKEGIDEICGVIYKEKQSESECGCKKRDRRFLTCGEGCKCAVAKKCRKPKFGIEKIKKCRHENFGVSSYKVCRKPQFGAESYQYCRAMEHGLEKINSCELEAVLKGRRYTLAICGKLKGNLDSLDEW